MILHDKINNKFTQIFDLVLKEEHNNLKKMGLKELTLNELHLLVKINELHLAGIDVTPKVLMYALHVTKGTLSTSTSKLISKNYLEKKYDSNDGRKIIFKIKPKAKYAIDLHDKWHEDFVSRAMQDIPILEQENILITLENIYTNIKR